MLEIITISNIYSYYGHKNKKYSAGLFRFPCLLLVLIMRNEILNPSLSLSSHLHLLLNLFYLAPKNKYNENEHIKFH